MKLTSGEAGQEYTIEILPDEFGRIRIQIEDRYVILTQVSALSLAWILEEQVKELRIQGAKDIRS